LLSGEIIILEYLKIAGMVLKYMPYDLTF